MTTDTHYAIPSYRRRALIETHTLALLLRNNVPMRNVSVFVSDEQDANEYRGLEEKYGLSVIYKEPLPDIVAKFNFIHDWYRPGTRVVFVEDDIESLAMKTGPNELKPFTGLEELALGMFELCEFKRTKLWGISSNANPFYMKDGSSVGFKFIVANLFGFISTRDPFLRISHHCKSDYERTMLYFARYSCVARADFVCAITKNYKYAGGLQEEKELRYERELAACRYLVRRFPHLCDHNVKKSTTSMYPELRLKTIRNPGLTDWMTMQRSIDKELAP